MVLLEPLGCLSISSPDVSTMTRMHTYTPMCLKTKNAHIHAYEHASEADALVAASLYCLAFIYTNELLYLESRTASNYSLTRRCLEGFLLKYFMGGVNHQFTGYNKEKQKKTS